MNYCMGCSPFCKGFSHEAFWSTQFPRSGQTPASRMGKALQPRQTIDMTATTSRIMVRFASLTPYHNIPSMTP